MKLLEHVPHYLHSYFPSSHFANFRSKEVHLLGKARSLLKSSSDSINILSQKHQKQALVIWGTGRQARLRISGRRTKGVTGSRSKKYHNSVLARIDLPAFLMTQWLRMNLYHLCHYLAQAMMGQFQAQSSRGPAFYCLELLLSLWEKHAWSNQWVQGENMHGYACYTC